MGKNILIQSESNDRSTDDVLSWLYHINDNWEIETLFNCYGIKNFEMEISNSNFEIKINNLEIKANSSIWYRRGKIGFSLERFQMFQEMQQNIVAENLLPIVEFLNKFMVKNQINKFQENSIGKLEMLYECKKININFPDTLITSCMKEVKNFLRKHGRIITKPVKNPFTNAILNNQNVRFNTPTILLDENNALPDLDSFLPSLFQKYIEKKYEIRSFYLNRKFYSMAIFSQQNAKTKIDFRNYDYERPNRVVPYNLPKSYELKLSKLMKELDINCGSFDIIVSPEDQYFFLEVNPIGQFQWLSRNCNYYIEKIIAETLNSK